MKRMRPTVFLFVVLVLLHPAAAFPQEIPEDFTPFVRLGHLVKVSVYKDPQMDSSGKQVLRQGQLLSQRVMGVPVGSGTIISSGGLILTNFHVYRFEDQFRFDKARGLLLVSQQADRSMLVYGLADNDPLKEPVLQYTASPVSLDPQHDIALLKITTDKDGNKIKGLSFGYARFGNPFDIKLNESIAILGYPQKGGDTITVTDGKFLGYYRNKNFPGLDGFIKTNAAMAPGNSGGAALNKNLLVGIPTAVTLPTSAGSDLGYIHPVTWALKTLLVAQHKFRLPVPDIPLAWLTSTYNSDESAAFVYISGHIISAQSRQPLEASVIASRWDRSMMEVRRLHNDIQSVRNIYLAQRMRFEGIPVEEISKQLKISPARIEKMLQFRLDEKNLTPDTIKYLQGEFFYEAGISDPSGFFLLKVPRGMKVRLYVNKKGFRSLEEGLQETSLISVYLGDVQLFQY
jgi:S1-C subfamily serine protease